ncbi:hypothetical protein JCM19992_07140 [Thermostilla marina]
MLRPAAVVLSGLVVTISLGGPTAAAPPQPVETTLGGAEPFPRLLYTFNTNLLLDTALHGIGYDSPEFRRLVASIEPAGLRFPGGTIANNYLWRQDGFSDPVGDRTGWARRQLTLFREIGRPYGLPGYIDTCRRFKFEPIWVLNVYETSPEDAVALLEHLAAEGLRVRRIEMGNEPYWDPRSLINVWQYLQACRPLAKALKAHDPAIEIGACFGPVHSETTDYRAKWNAVLAKETWFDAIVYHEYFGGQGIALEAGTSLPATALLHPEAMFDDAVAEFASLLPHRPIWFTEWNLGQTALRRYKNTGAELLFLGSAFCRLFDHRDRITAACFHQIWGAPFGTVSYDKESGTVRRAASWDFFRLLGATIGDADRFVPVEFSSTALCGFAVRADEALRLFVVHRGGEPLLLHLPPELGDAAVTCLRCSAEAVLPTDVSRLESARAAGDYLLVPAESILAVGVSCPPDDAHTARNLFPHRPTLQLWYPPYAKEQPRFDADGVYRLDTTKLQDAKPVVLTIDLQSLELEKETRYALTFQARCDPAAGIVVNVPREPSAEAAGRFFSLNDRFQPISVGFSIPEHADTQAVSIVFPDSTLARKPTIEFRDFSLTREP